MTKSNQNPEKFVEKLGLFFLRIFKLVARFSKYDFWIPGKISDLYGYKKVEKYFSKIKKKSRTKNMFEKILIFSTENFQFPIKIENSILEFPKRSKIFDFSHFSSKKHFSFFCSRCFLSCFFFNFFYPYKSEMFPGIQKSYLENRAMSLKIPKTTDPQKSAANPRIRNQFSGQRLE